MPTIKERLDEETTPVDAWRPEPGEDLEGVVRRYNMRKMDDGNDYPVVTVERPDGEKFAFHAFHSVARGQLEEDLPRVGDEIGIRYLGKVDGEQYEYHNYRIAVEHKTPEPPASEAASPAMPSPASPSSHPAASSYANDDNIPF